MKSHLKNAVWAGWEYVAKRAGRSYVAGSRLSDAAQVCQRFARQDLTSTVCYWNGEHDEPDFVARQYLDALESLPRFGFDCYLSIKAPALGFSHDLVAEVVKLARLSGIRVHFDSHSVEEADPTFELIAESASRWSQISCTLPGRWHRSLEDADRVCEMGIIPRVVKGQWIDLLHPGIDLREGFLKVVDRLAGRARHVAVASHDVPLAREALRRLKNSGTSCELELIYGLPLHGSLRMANEEKTEVRLYVPYGDAWFPYCLSQMKKNPRMLMWVIQNLIVGQYLSLLDAVRHRSASLRERS